MKTPIMAAYTSGQQWLVIIVGLALVVTGVLLLRGEGRDEFILDLFGKIRMKTGQLGVVLIVLGEGLAFGSMLTLIYAAVIAIVFQLRVVYYEEPSLAQRFGDEWTRYSTAVCRWWPRGTPWAGE